MIDEAAKLAGISFRELIQKGISGELSVYALGDWIWFSREEPDKRYNVREPIFMDDIDHLRKLVISDGFQLHVDCKGRNIRGRGCDDSNYLDGVTVGGINLFFLRSEIEDLKFHMASETVTEMEGGQPAEQEWQVLEFDAEREKILQAELEAERQRRNAELAKGIDFEWKTEANLEQAEKNTKSETDKTKEWRAKAREIGEDFIGAERKKGRDPGVNAVAKHVDGEFKRLDIRGKRDDYLDWQTIKKEALTGITGRPPNGKCKKS